LPVIEQRSANAALADELGIALREAGQIALKYFRRSIKSWTKGHDSPVSEADIAVDEFLRARLARQEYGWLSGRARTTAPGSILNGS
jgi:myo-inositol-1(or 4)-monophosphatase